VELEERETGYDTINSRSIDVKCRIFGTGLSSREIKVALTVLGKLVVSN
jgi:hypothetical protein